MIVSVIRYNKTQRLEGIHRRVQCLYLGEYRLMLEWCANVCLLTQRRWALSAKASRNFTNTELNMTCIVTLKIDRYW